MADPQHVRGTFEVAITPDAGGTEQVARWHLAKTYAGDAVGTGAGLMLSAGDPSVGAAGYVAMEVAEVAIGDRTGSFALQQLGTMADGEQSLTYLVTPGSGTGDLAGIAGRLDLDIRDGVHHYDLVVELPE